jgi:hypothetical protein
MPQKVQTDMDIDETKPMYDTAFEVLGYVTAQLQDEINESSSREDFCDRLESVFLSLATDFRQAAERAAKRYGATEKAGAA